MARGVLLGLAVMLAFAIFPPAFPVGPFVGGYLGIRSALGQPGSAGRKALVFGLALAALFLIVAALAALAVSSVVALSGQLKIVMWLGVAIFTFYTASMSAMGALYAQLKRA